MKKTTLFMFTVALLFFTLWTKAEAQVAVIVNNSNSICDLTLGELKKIYLGRITAFSNGKKVLLGEYAPLKEKFYRVVLHKTVDKVKKHWISVVFSGGSATPPKEFKDIDEVKKFVSKNVGAISFIELSDADKSVKILTIEGKKPGSANYLLK